MDKREVNERLRKARQRYATAFTHQRNLDAVYILIAGLGVMVCFVWLMGIVS